MNVIISVGILVFAMLIFAFLQLVPGIFLLFHQYASGKYSKNRSTDLITFFILGVETTVALIFLSLLFILGISPAITHAVDNDIFSWIMSGVFFAAAIALFMFYYRRGRGSKLFIPRRLASHYQAKIPTIKTRSDAFVFGLIAGVPELCFTLPVYIIATTTMNQLGLSSPEHAGLIILFALAAVLPLFLFHIFTHTYNFADLIRFRFKHKSFFRFCLSFFYFLIAIFIIMGVLI